MAIERKGNTTPAFRYFVFILFLCIFLFVFLMTRLMTTGSSAFIQNQTERPSFRVEAAPPPIDEANLFPASINRHEEFAVHPYFLANEE